MASRVRERGGSTLFHGQRKSKKSRECDFCQSAICKGEYYWVRVELIVSDDRWETISQTTACIMCGDRV